jgi:hypothetical protein
MRVPRVRFTVRTLMALVAVAAIVFGGALLWHTASSYREKALYHANLQSSMIMAFGDLDSVDEAELARVSEAWRTCHSALRRKYERAASRPWEYVPPDPPEPVLASGQFVADWRPTPTPPRKKGGSP